MLTTEWWIIRKILEQKHGTNLEGVKNVLMHFFQPVTLYLCANNLTCILVILVVIRLKEK